MNLFRRKESLWLDDLLCSLPDLAVDTGVAAGLGGDIVDAEALAEAPRGNGAERNVVFRGGAHSTFDLC